MRTFMSCNGAMGKVRREQMCSDLWSSKPKTMSMYHLHPTFHKKKAHHTKHQYISNTQNNPELIEYVKKCWNIKLIPNPCIMFFASLFFLSTFFFVNIFLRFDFLCFCFFPLAFISFFIFLDKRRIMEREIVHFSTLFLTTCKIQPK